MKDNKSLLLILLSAGLVITWIYHIYDKSRYSSNTHEVFLNDSLALVQSVTDSLRKEFKQRLDSIGTEQINANLVNDTLQPKTGQDIEEIGRLRKEIDDILEKKNLTQADLNEANAKINLLQQRMENLRIENSSLVEENKRLNNDLIQSSEEKNSEETNTGKAATEKTSVSKLNSNSTFSVSGIRFAALGNKIEQENETTLRENAQKFTCSFILQNNKTDLPQTEIFIVITDPDGKSVNTEVWDAGSFDTRSEGKKVFTRKLKFDYRKGEAKKISITVEPGVFEKGLYKLGIYQNGIRIGDSSWKLS